MDWLKRRSLVVVSMILASGLFSLAAAQEPKLSQHGTVIQRIAGTEVKIEYNRPVARGRTLFGALVPWGRTWNPGADQATSIHFSTPAKVEGQALEAGDYSLWTEPQQDRWTV